MAATTGEAALAGEAADPARRPWGGGADCEITARQGSVDGGGT